MNSEARTYTRRTIGPTAGHFNLDTLVPALIKASGGHIESLPAPTFWRIANRHQLLNVGAGIGLAA